MTTDAFAGDQWRESTTRPFTQEERKTTTLWLGGFTRRHDEFLCAAGRGRGYNMWPLPVPDNESLKIGKEYGNRGQCNPTYYTAGNLVRKLKGLQASGASTEEILRNNAFITVGSCGPCRFGMYSTEYRKALREAGFEGFRILQLRQSDIVGGSLVGEGLEFNLRFIVALVKAIIAADILSMIGHHIRPYEATVGATNAALHSCEELVVDALQERKSVLQALRRCRQILRGVDVDRLQQKPVVCVIGEIWAMTTEGDGNYDMHRFIEDEGAEVLIEPIFNWLIYIFWEQKRDVSIRQFLRGDDPGNRGLRGKDPWRRLLVAKLVEPVLRLTIRSFAAAAAFTRPHIANIDNMALATRQHYDSEIRGGEAFMEVGKFMDIAQHKLAHLVLSVKPFGCLPSSGVSDGVQSLISARYPDTAFYAVETTGDGRSSIYSRIQMMLYNAHKHAQMEFQDALAKIGIDEQEARKRLERDPVRHRATFSPHHHYATTAANMILELH